MVAAAVVASIAVPVFKFAGSAIVLAIRELYHIADDINDWMDSHLKEMQSSENLTISRTGKVLEAAKTGFGLGYVAYVTVIAVGQFLLGNPLSAGKTILTAATLSNPMAMTCAALGAIIYGWSALSKEEQQDVLDRISSGLEIGIEFIKAVVNFIISYSKDALNSKNIAELKEILRKAAKEFGKKLGQVTRKFSDIVNDVALETREKTTKTFNDISKATKNGLDMNGDGTLSLDDVNYIYKKFTPSLARKKEGPALLPPESPEASSSD